MRRLRAGSATAVLLTATLIACAPAEPAFTDADADAVNAVDDQFTTAMKAGDWDAWSNLMTDDVAFFPPNGPAVEGRAAVRAFGEAFPRLTEFTAAATETVGHGDLAYTRGTYSFTATPDSGPPVSDRGKFLSTHRRQADGSWRLSRNIWNSDLPLPAAPGN